MQESLCSTNLQNFWAGTYVIFQVGVGTKRKNLRISYGPNQKEAHGPGTTPAERETRVRYQGSQMHEAMGVVLNPINSSCRYAVARFIGSTLHFDCSTHGSSRLALRPSLLNSAAFDVLLFGTYVFRADTPQAELPVITFDSWQLMRVAL